MLTPGDRITLQSAARAVLLTSWLLIDATSTEGIISTHLRQVAQKYSPVPIDLVIRADFESFPS